jgi:hypothetical protein
MTYLNLETYGDNNLNLNKYITRLLGFVKSNLIGLVGISLSLFL